MAWFRDDYTRYELDSMERERRRLSREKRKKYPSTPRFTIAQIERYLKGKHFLHSDGLSKPDCPYNMALDLAISCLRDERDGIRAELERDKDRQRTK